MLHCGLLFVIGCIYCFFSGMVNGKSQIFGHTQLLHFGVALQFGAAKSKSLGRLIGEPKAKQSYLHHPCHIKIIAKFNGVFCLQALAVTLVTQGADFGKMLLKYAGEFSNLNVKMISVVLEKVEFSEICKCWLFTFLLYCKFISMLVGAWNQ